MPQVNDAEKRRIEESRTGAKDWRRWGPYLSERQWGTVREDYSPDGTAWDYFTHDQARSRAYRWGEDGIAGFCDDRQLLCLSLALWNGTRPDPEGAPVRPDQRGGQSRRGRQGALLLSRRRRRATPTRACSTSYPQAAYPYEWLIEENARRDGSAAPEFELIDTGIFDDDRYFDVEVEYAKADADDMLMRVTVHNRGPDAATHPHPAAGLVPQHLELVAGRARSRRCARTGAGRSSRRSTSELGAVRASHSTRPDRLLFCDNETNFARLFGTTRRRATSRTRSTTIVVHGRTRRGESRR